MWQELLTLIDCQRWGSHSAMSPGSADSKAEHVFPVGTICTHIYIHPPTDLLSCSPATPAWCLWEARLHLASVGHGQSSILTCLLTQDQPLLSPVPLFSFACSPHPDHLCRPLVLPIISVGQFQSTLPRHLIMCLVPSGRNPLVSKMVAGSQSHWPPVSGISPSPWSQLQAPLGFPCSDQAIGVLSLSSVTVYRDDHLTCQYQEGSAKCPHSSYSCLVLPTISSRELRAATSASAIHLVIRGTHDMWKLWRSPSAAESYWLIRLFPNGFSCLLIKHLALLSFVPRQSWTPWTLVSVCLN